jgi:tetratricopeptide (TPR) repeat protein
VDVQHGQGLPGEPANLQAIEAVERGIQYLENEKGDRAIECFTEAIRLCPEFTSAYFARACAYEDKGDFKLAIADCTEVIRLDPDHLRAYRLRGSIYQTMGKWSQAGRDLAEVGRIEARQQ